MKMKLNHIGIAAENISETIKDISKYLNIMNVGTIVFDKEQDANLCMITLEDNTKIEIISGNQVKNLVSKKQYLYHTCYSVDNIEKAIDDLIKDGALLVSNTKKAILFNNKKVAFLYWKLGLIELLEE